MQNPPQSTVKKQNTANPPRSRFWQIFWLSFLVFSLAYAWYSFYVPANQVDWSADYATAQQKSVQTGKPMILFFTGKWCVPCRIMKREIWANPDVTQHVNQNFVPVQIDVNNEDSEEIMNGYKIKGAPVMIVTDANGNVLGWRAGKIQKQEFMNLLKSAVSLRSEEKLLPSHASH